MDKVVGGEGTWIITPSEQAGRLDIIFFKDERLSMVKVLVRVGLDKLPPQVIRRAGSISCEDVNVFIEAMKDRNTDILIL